MEWGSLQLDENESIPAAPTTPARPPSPFSGDGSPVDSHADELLLAAQSLPAELKKDGLLPVAPPPRVSRSLPAELKADCLVPAPPRTGLPTTAFRRTKFMELRPLATRPTGAPASLTASVQSRSSSTWGFGDQRPSNVSATVGSFGPSMYDVKCSKTGSPLGKGKGTPRFGAGERYDRRKCYEGKENKRMHDSLLGGYGHLSYDVKCSNMGSPLGRATGGSPRFATGERFNRSKCYEGKENNHMLLGSFGPGLYDIRCSPRGSPLWKNRPGAGGTAAFALPHVPKQRRRSTDW